MAEWRSLVCRRGAQGLAFLLAAAILVYIAVTAWGPTVAASRDEILSTPSLPGLAVRTDVRLSSHASLCVRPVVFPARTTRTVVQAVGVRRPDKVSAWVDNGAHRVFARGVTLVGGVSLVAQFAPGRGADHAAVCYRNGQRRRIAFVGTTETRSLVVADAYVNGRRQEADIALSLLGGKTSLSSELPRSAKRAAIMAGVPGWSWLVRVLVVAAIFGAACLLGLMVAVGPAGPSRRTGDAG